MKPIEILVEKINAAVTGELMFALDAPVKVPVLRDDGTYKTISMVGNEEFFLKGARAGANDKLIFEFTPSDARPYSQAEFNEKVVFQAFGDEIYGLVKKAIGAGEDEEWARARSAFLKKIEKEQTMAARQAAEVEEQKEADHYGDNPLWGAF
jgi:hypothetical protein